MSRGRPLRNPPLPVYPTRGHHTRAVGITSCNVDPGRDLGPRIEPSHLAWAQTLDAQALPAVVDGDAGPASSASTPEDPRARPARLRARPAAGAGLAGCSVGSIP